MPDKPEQTQRRVVAQSRLFRIDEVGLRFSNGHEVVFEHLASNHGGGAVLIVAVTADDTVIMVHEYAVGTDRYELGLPKGRAEAGEAVEAAARRELREEVGYDAGSLLPLRRVTLAPGYIAHETTIILARTLTYAPLAGDEPEPLPVTYWPLSRFDELIANAELTEARSIAALYLARSFIQGTTGEIQA